MREEREREQRAEKVTYLAALAEELEEPLGTSSEERDSSWLERGSLPSLRTVVTSPGAEVVSELPSSRGVSAESRGVSVESRGVSAESRGVSASVTTSVGCCTVASSVAPGAVASSSVPLTDDSEGARASEVSDSEEVKASWTCLTVVVDSTPLVASCAPVASVRGDSATRGDSAGRGESTTRTALSCGGAGFAAEEEDEDDEDEDEEAGEDDDVATGSTGAVCRCKR